VKKWKEESEMNDNGWRDTVLDAAMRVRRRALDVCAANNGGYLVQACGSAEIMTTLYLKLMDLGPSTGALTPPAFEGVPRPGAPMQHGDIYNGDRDLFFLSPAHYALGLYATLCEAGRLDEDCLAHTNADGSILEMIGAEHSPGFASTTGSLAQALSVAVGRALARKRFGRDGRVWALISDGETEEGQTWEALQAAANFELDNLTVFLDANGLQVDGWVVDVMRVEPLHEKARAFGWNVIEVNGHEPAELVEAVTALPSGLPTLVVCRTNPIHRMPSLEGRHQLHYIRFREGEVDAIRNDLAVQQEVYA
jgi:transketolase